MTDEMTGGRSARPLWRRILKVVAWLGAGAIALAVVGFFIAYWRSDNDCGKQAGAAPAATMKAIIRCDWGTAEGLRLEDIEKPAPADDQVLVKVRAASINPLDWHFVRGTPYLLRIDAGLRKPKITRLGVDFAGTVEAVGKSVTRFKPGDDVFGGRFGAFAQYVVVREDGDIVPKPPNLTFEEAAAIPIAGVTALQSVRDRARAKPGLKILINGVSGGVGTFAVQIAKSMGAEVTGVCSTRNLDMVRSLGADHVIDYTKEDFTKMPEKYDVLIDNVVNRSLSECRGVLTPQGKYIMIGGGGPDAGNWIGPFGRVLHAYLMSKFVSQEMGMLLADMNKQDLAALGDLMQAGKVKSVIDRRYTLSEVPAAIEYVEKGHARGKVVITVE